MKQYNIYRISPDGTGTWATTDHDAGTKSPGEALEQAHTKLGDGLIPRDELFVVVDPVRNPRGEQIVFRLVDRPVTSLQAVPATL